MNKLNFWPVYKNPTDFPDLYVSRRFILDKPTKDHFSHKDKSAVLTWINEQAVIYGLGAPYCIQTDELDDPKIVEIWV